MAEASEHASEHPLGAEEALGWTGFKLDELAGSSVGRVEGVLVDSSGGQPTWLLVRLGRFGRRTAVPFEHAAGAAGRVWVPHARDVIRSAPEIDPGAGLTPAEELELCAHYGLPEDSPLRRRLDSGGGDRSSVPRLG